MRNISIFLIMTVLINFNMTYGFKSCKLSRCKLSKIISLNSVLLPEKKQVKKQNFKIIQNPTNPKNTPDVEYKTLSGADRFPMWKVVLIKNEEYDKKQVVNKLNK